MPRTAPLTAGEVAALKKDGVHRVDVGLYLQIRNDGAKRSWLLRYRFGGRMRWMGLGPARLVTLTDAKRRAKAAQLLLLDGIDPMAARNAEREKVGVKTFAECATECIASMKSGWSNDKHAYQWTQSIETYANPVLGKLKVDQVTTNDVVKVLEPIWAEKSETADKLRNRIERVLDWAKASGMRSGDNPAAWRGALEYRLPPLSKVQIIVNHVAIPYADAPAVYAKLCEAETTSALALRLVMLTASRVGELLGATWQEFDLDAEIPVWTVPGSRMKMRRPHRVPLSPPAVELLRQIRRPNAKPTDLVISGKVRGKKLSDAAVRKALRKVSTPDADTHGLRSTFRDWTAEQTDHPVDVAKAAIAHTLGDKSETAYLRTDLFERRAELMSDWADFLTDTAPPAQ
jgi:integrase